MSDELQVRLPEEAELPPPRRRWLKDLVVLVGGGLTLWFGLGWLRAPSLPTEAPDFRLPTLTGGQIRLSELRGKKVLLNFWATWCGPCRLELPSLLAFAKDHPEVPLYFVAMDGKMEDLITFAKAEGMPLDQVLRIDASTNAAYGVKTLPTTLVVTEEGHTGPVHAGIVVGPQLWWMTR